MKVPVGVASGQVNKLYCKFKVAPEENDLAYGVARLKIGQIVSQVPRGQFNFIFSPVVPYVQTMFGVYMFEN